MSVTLFKNNDPDQGLTITIYRGDNSSAPTGKALFTETVSASAIGWSAKNIVLAPGLPVEKGERYMVVLSSSATSGFYGIALGEVVRIPDGVTAVSRDGGVTFTVVDKQRLKFQAFITTGKR